MTDWAVVAQSASTVLVALTVAYFTSRRETRKQLAERHFAFRDQRVELYVSFIDELNRTFRLHMLGGEGEEDVTGELDEAAMTLESKVDELRITAPIFVYVPCLTASSELHRVVAQFTTEESVFEIPEDFERKKRAALDAIRQDVDFIEGTLDRASYSRMVAAVSRSN